MILWSNGTTTRPGITLATGTYENPEWTANKMSRVLVKRTWVDVWTGSCIERLLEHDSVFTFAEVDATPDVIALAEAWRADEAYREERRSEAIQNCSAQLLHLSLVCAQPWRGFVVRLVPLPAWRSQADGLSLQRRQHMCCNIPLDLVEATGVSEGERPAWAPSITWLSNKNRVLGYLAMKRMATEPEFLAQIEAHGRLLLDMDGQRPPGSWARHNNVLFGMEPKT